MVKKISNKNVVIVHVNTVKRVARRRVKRTPSRASFPLANYAELGSALPPYRIIHEHYPLHHQIATINQTTALPQVTQVPQPSKAPASVSIRDELNTLSPEVLRQKIAFYSDEITKGLNKTELANRLRELVK